MNSQARITFDNLWERQNYRELFDRSVELGLALAQDAERAEQLKSVVRNISKIDGMIAQSEEFVAQGNAFGAWELLAESATIYPDDPVLNRAQVKLAPKVAEFAGLIDKAQSSEQAGQYVESLHAYLNVKTVYPLQESPASE